MQGMALGGKHEYYGNHHERLQNNSSWLGGKERALTRMNLIISMVTKSDMGMVYENNILQSSW
jgi:hypothetical protein